jgi:predicted nuclease of predicted toxin-antitoxin system
LRFLVDNALSEEIARALRTAGHEALHVRALGMAAASDASVLSLALSQGSTVISPDDDFSQLLAASGAEKPSILSLQTRARRPSRQAAIVVANLTEEVLGALAGGAVVVIEDGRVRIRRLPLP